MLQFRPFEENRVPSYILQDDYADIPYEMFKKEIEIPDVDVKFENQSAGCQLYIVPEQLKRRAALQKKYKRREKVGTIAIHLAETSQANDDDLDDDFDDTEQMYFQKQPQSKYKYMYGTQDMRNISIFQLAMADGKKHLLIEVPQFRNYLMYNLLAVRLLEALKPEKVHLFVEETERTAEKSSAQVKSTEMMVEFLNGSYRGPCGELGLSGIVASFLNIEALESVDFVAVERSTDVKTLYL